ncbi:MAG: helix-turn-helix transcriptional regulator [Microthrixaceae bacterium]
MSATASERVERVLAILPWLIEHPDVEVAEVCRRFDVARDDLVRDLDTVFMEVGVHPFTPDARVDVVIDEDRVSVHLGDYFRRPLRLTPEEAVTLLAAGRAALDGPEPPPALGPAVDKLAAVLGAAGERVDVNTGGADPDVLATVRQAVEEHGVLELDYWSFGRDEFTRREVEPARLELADGHWYLRAHCRTAGGDRVFRVDRMVAATATGEHFAAADAPEPFDFDPSLVDRSLALVLGPDTAWVAETYPVADVVDLPDGRRRVVLGVTATAWLERLLLRLGPDAEPTDADTGEGLAPVAARAADRVLRRYR